jgi:phosphopantothenoylcysteine decarboxylase / phosphopantothenate---cysteine ligase
MSRDILVGKHIVLGVCGSIAAYKAVALASALHQSGAVVDVAMTGEAAELVRPLSFQAITHRPVALDMFALLAETEIGHVSLGQLADAVLVAPATAHTLAKIACGLADDLVSSTLLATRAPVVIAPAMDAGMYENPAVRENVNRLRERGYVIVEPDVGRLASGLVGRGRLAEQEVILSALRQTLGRGGDLAGWRVIVAAGGTQEPIDPVRVITNRSSGKMGYALAEAARDRGASVVLVAAPTALLTPPGVELRHVESAEQMCHAVLAELDRADALIMAAAVADYRPRQVAEQKMKKKEAVLSLELEPTTDILVETLGRGRDGLVRVGFAAESEQLVENARGKLERKRLDLIVANDVSLPGSGFAVETNKATILGPGGLELDLPLMPKRDLAHAILDQVVVARQHKGKTGAG